MPSSDPQPSPSYDPPLRNCPLCGQADLRHYDEDFRGHRIDRCADCGVMLMNPQYTDQWLDHHYSQYSPHAADRAGRWRGKIEVRRIGKTRSLELIERFGQTGRILMIGSGDGMELEVATERGWQAEGYDVDADNCATVAERCGVPVHSGRFEDLRLPSDQFDAVFLDQVIEHPKNPGDYLAEAQRLLKPGGILYLGLPNIGSISNRTKTAIGRLGLRRKRRGKHYASQHHIFYYSPAVARHLLEQHYGFDVLQISGSLKPDQNRFKEALARRFALLDSSFVILARKRA